MPGLAGRLFIPTCGGKWSRTAKTSTAKSPGQLSGSVKIRRNRSGLQAAWLFTKPRNEGSKVFRDAGKGRPFDSAQDPGCRGRKSTEANQQWPTWPPGVRKGHRPVGQARRPSSRNALPRRSTSSACHRRRHRRPDRSDRRAHPERSEVVRPNRPASAASATSAAAAKKPPKSPGGTETTSEDARQAPPRKTKPAGMTCQRTTNYAGNLIKQRGDRFAFVFFCLLQTQQEPNHLSSTPCHEPRHSTPSARFAAPGKHPRQLSAPRPGLHECRNKTANRLALAGGAHWVPSTKLARCA